MSSIRVLVWLPLPTGAGWRGEGIAQTIESIIQHSPEDVSFGLAISPHHYDTVAEVFETNPRVTLHRLSILPAPARRGASFDGEKLLVNPTSEFLGQRQLAKLGVLFAKILSRLRQLADLWAMSELQRRNMALRGYNAIWLPVASVAFSGRLRGRKVVSFWDPFVFEYSHFRDVQRALFAKFYSIIRTSEVVITQSDANKRYLADVLGVGRDNVAVINNGSPSYGDAHQSILRKLPAGVTASRSAILEYWPAKPIIRRSRADAINGYISDRINRSVLFRLVTSFSDLTKIIIVSTQHRPYKGFDSLFRTLNTLVKSNSHDWKFIFTTEVPRRILRKYSWSTARVFEMTRVDSEQHAWLYLISDLVIHPSLVEGGVGTYPQFEGASLGVPSLSQRGRHMEELQTKAQGQDISLLTVDLYQADAAANRIETLIKDNNERVANIRASENLRVSWHGVGEAYANVFRKFA